MRTKMISNEFEMPTPRWIISYTHALAPIAELPVKKIISAVHFITDLTLPYGEVAEDY